MSAIINNREILVVEYSTERNWLAHLPNVNWLCIIVDNDRDRRYVNEVIGKILAKDVSYICSLGDKAEKNYNLIEEEITFRQADIEKPYLPKHYIATAKHKDIEEGIWHAIYEAHHNDVIINKVVIIDLSSGSEIDKINRTLERIKK